MFKYIYIVLDIQHSEKLSTLFKTLFVVTSVCVSFSSRVVCAYDLGVCAPGTVKGVLSL